MSEVNDDDEDDEEGSGEVSISQCFNCLGFLVIDIIVLV